MAVPAKLKETTETQPSATADDCCHPDYHELGVHAPGRVAPDGPSDSGRQV